MPRIEPVPWEYLSDEQKQEIEASRKKGLSSKASMGSQVFAYSSAAFRSMKAANNELFRKGVIEPRLQEILRLRSASINQCDSCAAARKDPTMTEEDVACIVDPMMQGLTARQKLAVKYLDKMSLDCDSIDDAFFRELATEFSLAEIIELGWRNAIVIGGHKFMHSLNMFGVGDHVLSFDPSELDRTTAPDALRAAE